MAVEYILGAELPDIKLTWNDEETGLLDFSTGWTFSLRIGPLGGAEILTKNTGITGAATAPNVTIAWAAGEMDTLPVGSHVCQVQAHHTASNKDRRQQFPITIKQAVGAA